MKKIFLTLLVSLTVFAKEKGVMNGGGGELLPEQKMAYHNLLDVLASSRAELYLFFNAERYQDMRGYNQAHRELMRRLFDRAKTIIDVLKEYRIDRNAECKDADGKIVHASIHATKPFTICIDVYRVSAELYPNSIRAQVLSLLAHEYSHLIGFSEDEAVSLQKYVYSSIEKESADLVKSNFDGVYNGFSHVESFIKSIDAVYGIGLNWNSYCYFADQLWQKFSNVNKIQNSARFLVLDRAKERRFRAYVMKASALHASTCARSDFYPYRNTMKQTQERIFKKSNFMNAQEYSAFFNSWDVDATVYISAVDSLDQVKLQLQDILGFVQKEIQDLRTIDGLFRAPQN